ncbi:hypothetical protein MKW92_010070 [Papaver armeniacum]|nr:hypothetical protein MKW92_010070 [Papaver armeniacum]
MAQKRQRVSKSNNNNDHEMSSSWSIHETAKGSHEFKIEGYSLAKGMGVGKYMCSGKFTVGGYVWVLHFYPDSHSDVSKKYISLLLQLVSPRQEVRAVYEFELLDHNGKNNYVFVPHESPLTFNTEISWYVPTFGGLSIPMVLELC